MDAQITPQDKHYLQLAIAQAKVAREKGGDPFGAVLVRDDVILAETYDRCVAASDPTAHAELALISAYCREAQVFDLSGCTLYASTEPCPMCSGAIHWARISRVVFSVSQAMLQAMSGGAPKPACAPIINMGHRRVKVIGPLLAEEGLAVFDGYSWLSKSVRHRALWSQD